MSTALTVQSNQLLVRQFFTECWGRGNVDKLDDLLAPEHAHHLPGWELRASEVRQLILDLRSALPDFQIKIDDEIVAGDKVVIRWTIQGTHQGDLFGMAPTGRPIEYTGIDILRCANGKIVELWGQPDSAGLRRQLQPG